MTSEARNVSLMIAQVRQHTGQINYTTDTAGSPTRGVTQELILDYMNDGKNLMQSLIIQSFPEAFQETVEIDLDGSDSYTPDANILYNNKILMVEYSTTGEAKDYHALDQIPLRDRDENEGSYLDAYCLRNGDILPSPIANTGTMRVTFYQAIDKLDIRRGKIASKLSTSITLTSPDTTTPLDATGILSRESYLCTVDSVGVVKDYGVVISSYAAPTITIPSQTLVAVANDYVVVGKYASSHLRASEAVERYIKHYAQYRVFESQSSKRAAAEKSMMDEHLKDILRSYAQGDHDIKHIPVLDMDLFD